MNEDLINLEIRNERNKKYAKIILRLILILSIPLLLFLILTTINFFPCGIEFSSHFFYIKFFVSILILLLIFLPYIISLKLFKKGKFIKQMIVGILLFLVIQFFLWILLYGLNSALYVGTPDCHSKNELVPRY